MGSQNLDSKQSGAMTVVVLVSALLLSLVSATDQTYLEDCVRKHGMEEFKECCQEGEILIKTETAQYRCDKDPCNAENLNLMYHGECRDVHQSGVCGEDALGERLYLGEDGLGHCDCEEGWLRYRGRCYQEFTPAFCPGPDQILFLNKPEKGQIIWPEGGLELYLDGMKLNFSKGLYSSLVLYGIRGLELYLDGIKLNFSCLRNPCEPDHSNHSYLPHTSTWKTKSFCHSVPSSGDISDCELFVTDKERNKSDLVCCLPSEVRCKLNAKGEGLLTLLSVPTSARISKCGRGKVYSRYRRRCIKLYKL